MRTHVRTQEVRARNPRTRLRILCGYAHETVDAVLMILILEGVHMVDWERNWRGNGVIAAVLFVVSFIIYGSQPKLGASADKLVSFYDGDSTRVLISTVIFGFATLCLMWFAAALASVLRDAGKGGWGNAAIAAGAAIGAVYFVRITVRAALAYSIAGTGDNQVTSALNDFSWAVIVIGWFPVAMLIMAGSFGLWRAEIFSNAAFGAGVTAMVLVLLGTTTWAGDGFWAADGGYARFVPTIVMLLWIAVVSGFLMRQYSRVSARSEAPVPAA
jgi:hypothetical protein